MTKSATHGGFPWCFIRKDPFPKRKIPAGGQFIPLWGFRNLFHKDVERNRCMKRNQFNGHVGETVFSVMEGRMIIQKGKPNIRLRDERIRRHWSQQELADMIGATLNTVSRWERGLTDCSPYFRNKLCEVFGKSASQLWLVPDPEEEEAHPALFDPVLPATRKLVGRDELLNRLKNELRNTQEGNAFALVGMPGVGKSALALTFVRDAEVRECFYEGILWVDVGPQPNILNILSRWGALLGAEPSANSDLTLRDAWLLGLRMAIGTRRMLFIIDNVWRLEDAIVLMH